jgi:GNAT superfamily N-acetyltransferase
MGAVSAGPSPPSAPEPLRDDHDLEHFQCGVASLDDWLKRRARANQAGGASRTYVIAAGKRVIGYYCLSSGAIAVIEAPGNIRRNMPDPVPMTVMGRLAIDHLWQGKGIGVALLQDAVLRAAQAAEIIGIRGVLVHAISIEAKAFYEHHGFVPSRSNPMTLLLSLKGLAGR